MQCQRVRNIPDNASGLVVYHLAKLCEYDRGINPSQFATMNSLLYPTVHGLQDSHESQMCCKLIKSNVLGYFWLLETSYVEFIKPI